jgi:outer membrane protein assembly factor BamB
MQGKGMHLVQGGTGVKADRRPVAVALLLIALCGGMCAGQSSSDWPVYNGGLDGDHYSRLTQINRANVHRLKVAWSFDTGEKGGMQTNPLIVGGTLYGYTPSQKVVALDAATGKLKWKFDSGIAGTQPARGVSFWQDGAQGRIFAGVMNFLYCLDADTGRPIESFGELGRVDLRKELRGDYATQSIALTTPGVLYKDLIIVGGRNPSMCAPESCAGVSTPFRSRANPATKPGPRMHGRTRAQPTTGQAWHWMWSVALSMCLPVRQSWTSMAEIAWATTSMQILCWHWMPTRANGFGISRVCITTFGTVIFRRRLRCLP